MENSYNHGYITEKLFNGLLAGCIPIYYGTEEVFDIFNSNAFIYWDVHNPSTALQTISYLESNFTAYQEMSSAILLKDGINTINKYFSFHTDIGDGSLRKKIREMVGIL